MGFWPTLLFRHLVFVYSTYTRVLVFQLFYVRPVFGAVLCATSVLIAGV